MEYLFQHITDWLHGSQSGLLLIGGVVVWLLSRAQSVGEIRKLQAELVSIRVAQFEKVVSLDEKQREIITRLKSRLQSLLHALNSGDKAGAQAIRSEARDIFLLEYLGAYYQHTCISRWVFPKIRKELVDEEIIPFLYCCDWILTMLNQQAVLTYCEHDPIRLSEEDLGFAFRFVNKYTHPWELQRKRKLRALENKLIGMGE